MSSVLDAVTMDVFDFDGSRDRPSGMNVNVPGQTPEEKELVNLQIEALKKSMEPPSDEELALQTRMQEYYDQMMADNTLSPEEEADFDTEYELQLSALQDQYGIQMRDVGASRMADLVSRGVYETTTGEDIIAKDQQNYSSVLASNISELLNAKEIAKSDMDAAKKQMAQQGYNLTSGIIQQRQNDSLTQAATLQNYYTSQNALTASTALQNAIRSQQFEQWAYNDKMSALGNFAGMNIGISQSMFKNA